MMVQFQKFGDFDNIVFTGPPTVLPDVVHDSEVEAKNNNGVTVIEVNGGTPPTSNCNRSTTWHSNVHPFAHRTQQRYARKIHVASPLASSSNYPQYEESLEDSFEKILRSADQRKELILRQN